MDQACTVSICVKQCPANTNHTGRIIMFSFCSCLLLFLLARPLNGQFFHNPARPLTDNRKCHLPQISGRIYVFCLYIANDLQYQLFKICLSYQPCCNDLYTRGGRGTCIEHYVKKAWMRAFLFCGRRRFERNIYTSRPTYVWVKTE